MADETSTTVSATVRELLGESSKFFREVDGALQLDEPLSFEVCTPPGVGGADTPAPGVLIYISPKPGAKLPETWLPIMSAANLVWVGANESGNEIPVPRRVSLALLGADVAARETEIDRSRIYLTGFSGGGRVASMMMPFFLADFAGAIFICGANPVEPVGDDSRSLVPERRFVFLTGTGDFNLLDTQMAMQIFEMVGFENLRLDVIERMGHELPPANAMADAIAFVDRR